MRKVNPTDFRTNFISESDELLAHFQRLSSSLVGTQHYNKDVSQLASTGFLALYVGFERFVSFLFFGYLNRDSRKFSSDVSTRVLDSVKKKFGETTSPFVTVAMPIHITFYQAASLIDPKGYNLPFSNAKQLKDKANQWLAAPHRARITSLTDEDDRFIDTSRSIRDYIAHRSYASFKEMSQLLTTVSAGGGNANLGRGAYEVYNIGAFLKAIPTDRTRFQMYLERFKSIALKL